MNLFASINLIKSEVFVIRQNHVYGCEIDIVDSCILMSDLMQKYVE